MTPQELYQAIITSEMGVVPNVSRRDFKKMMDSLSSEELRKVTRKYRKAWRKAARYFRVKKFTNKRSKRQITYDYVRVVASMASRNDPNWKLVWPATRLLAEKCETG